ncbi:MAG: hypothetical protein ACLQGP_07475 [Isosphaeraceae bacterium]
MSLNADQLYALLPAIYRTRDAENGGPLQALLAVIAGQSAILEENILQLYDDEFIETCAPWVIPYIGDLIGVNPIYEITGQVSGLRRAEVANTIGYRRRKGTLLALEQVTMDASGRTTAAVEFFKRLITTESMHHVRPQHFTNVDLRRGGELEWMNTAFDTLNRTIDVRRIAPRVRMPADPDPTPLDINLHGGGRFNIPDIGIYIWRWISFQVIQAPAFAVDGRRYMFSPLGQDIPLFNLQPNRTSFSRLTTRLDAPQPIRRREFFHDPSQFYGPGLSIQLFADGVPIDVCQICCRDLSDGPGSSWGCTPKGKIGIDPKLGRIELGPDVPVPGQMQVTYCYGFPAEIGGGPYDRSQSFSLPSSPNTYTAVVGSSGTPTLESAIAGWNAQPTKTLGLILLPGFESFDIDLPGPAAIILPSESQLYILSAAVDPGGNPADAIYSGSCATLRGDIEVRGQQAPVAEGGSIPPAGQLVISGLWISGAIRIGGDPSTVQLLDCTLVPGIGLSRDGRPVSPGEPSVVATAIGVSLSLVRCISGPVGVMFGGMTQICTCIIDSSSRCGVAYAGADLASEGADLHIEDSTVIGKVWAHSMELASNTIFLARRPRHDPWDASLWCSTRQTGCVRFCFLPSDAIVPRQFECLPADPSQEDAFLPQFVTLEYGHPSYGLLSGDAPMAIWTGADNGSQIGVYNFIQETEAVRNVQLRAPEYLPFSLEAGIFLEPSRAAVIRPVHHVYGVGLRTDADCCADLEDDELAYTGIGASLI